MAKKWTRVFQNLIACGLAPNKLKLVSSDGGLGLPEAKNVDHAKHDRSSSANNS
ncbi:MAG: hypothetical protein ACKPCM_15560 [Pseudanabaena sp.]